MDKKKFFITILTLTILFLFIVPGNLAVVLTTTPKYVDGKSYFLPTEQVVFESILDIEATENVPIHKMNFIIYDSESNVLKNCSFGIGGAVMSGCSYMTITLNNGNLNYTNVTDAFGYGYSIDGEYGIHNFNYNYGYGYLGYGNYIGYANYGYGYGYGYGLHTNLKEFNYTITWNASDDSQGGVGRYTAMLTALANDGVNSFVYAQAEATDFRIRRATQDDDDDDSSTGGGSSSGSGTAPAADVPVVLDQQDQLIKTFLGDVTKLSLSNGGQHTMTVQEVGDDYVILLFQSTPKEVRLNEGESATVDLDDDNVDDIYVMLNSISGNNLDLAIRELPPPTVDDTDDQTDDGSQDQQQQDQTQDQKKDDQKKDTEVKDADISKKDKDTSSVPKTILGILLVLVVIILVVGAWLMKNPPGKGASDNTPVYYKKVDGSTPPPAKPDKAKKNIGKY